MPNDKLTRTAEPAWLGAVRELLEAIERVPLWGNVELWHTQRVDDLNIIVGEEAESFLSDLRQEDRPEARRRVCAPHHERFRKLLHGGNPAAVVAIAAEDQSLPAEQRETPPPIHAGADQDTRAARRACGMPGGGFGTVTASVIEASLSCPILCAGCLLRARRRLRGVLDVASEAVGSATPRDEPKDNTWLTVTQTAERLGIKADRVSKMCSDGRLTAVGHGRARRIEPASILAYEDHAPRTVKQVQHRAKREQNRWSPAERENRREPRQH